MRRRALLLLVSLGVAACDAPFDPFAGAALYVHLEGTLDADQGTQRLRVEPLATSLGPTPALATVASTDAGGNETAWRDALGDGLYTATLQPAPGSTLRLTATRTDGRAATVTVTLPTAPTLVPATPIVTGTVVRQEVALFPLAGTPSSAEVVYEALRLADAQPFTYRVAYPVRQVADRRFVLVDYLNDLRGLRSLAEVPPDTLGVLGLRHIALHVTLTSPLPPARFAFEQGAGDVRGQARFDLPYRLAPDVLLQINLVDLQSGG